MVIQEFQDDFVVDLKMCHTSIQMEQRITCIYMYIKHWTNSKEAKKEWLLGLCGYKGVEEWDEKNACKYKEKQWKWTQKWPYATLGT